MFSRLSIRNKIAIVIALLLIGMTGMGILAINKMGYINSKTVEIQGNLLPSVRALGELRTGTNNYRNVVRGHLLVEGETGKRAAEQRLQVQEDANIKTARAYEK